jgi:hypothetical protein
MRKILSRASDRDGVVWQGCYMQPANSTAQLARVGLMQIIFSPDFAKLWGLLSASTLVLTAIGTTCEDKEV